MVQVLELSTDLSNFDLYEIFGNIPNNAGFMKIDFQGLYVLSLDKGVAELE